MNSIRLESPAFVEAYRTAPGAVVIDVRTPTEYHHGHMQDAINIPYGHASFLDDVRALDTSVPYFVYCFSGARSAHACALMKEAGISYIVDLAGGIGRAPELLDT
jgi:rhodanese-related sulfurtransferase